MKLSRPLPPYARVQPEPDSEPVPKPTREDALFLRGGDVRSGVVEAVLEDSDIIKFFVLLRDAARRSDADGNTWYVVRSQYKLYVTGVQPVDTRDIDAIYLAEVPPARKRQASFTAFIEWFEKAALEGRVTWLRITTPPKDSSQS